MQIKNNLRLMNWKGVLISLGAVILTVGIINYALGNVTIPNSFTNGTVADATQVNANFQALANAMPGVKIASVPDNSNITSVYPAGTQLGSISVTIPAAGNVMVSSFGAICLNNHTNGLADMLWLKISKTSGAVTGGGSYSTVAIPAELPTYGRSCGPLGGSYIFAETAAGTYTYYLNMATNTTGSLKGETLGTSLIAQYFPNTLP
ncbi:MAG: hypothetical protein HY036_01630 [Nitrospirae bacterium]|nr:hypothetical protein [Nitrospirota bacterium]